MNLKTFSDTELINKTLDIVRQEREILTIVLHHLQEVNRRRLYSYYGYKSLFDFAVVKLGYTKEAAYRRISAMKLLSEIPEMEEKLNSGEINLTHLSLAQSLFRHEKKICNEFTLQKKVEVLQKISNKPVREAEKITMSLASSATILKVDKVKPVSVDKVEMRFIVDEVVQDKIVKLKGYIAHKHPNISLGELFNKLCDLGLIEWDPSKPTKRHKGKRKAAIIHGKAPSTFAAKHPNATEIDLSEEKTIQFSAQRKNEPANQQNSILEDQNAELTDLGLDSIKLSKSNSESKFSAPRISKPIPNRIRRFVFQKAKNTCENCHSTFALELDHIVPRSLGGSDDPVNLRLLCRSCNQRAAIAKLGAQRMERYCR